MFWKFNLQSKLCISSLKGPFLNFAKIGTFGWSWNFCWRQQLRHFSNNFPRYLLLAWFSDIYCNIYLKEHKRCFPTVYNMTYFGEKKFHFSLEPILVCKIHKQVFWRWVWVLKCFFPPKLPSYQVSCFLLKNAQSMHTFPGLIPVIRTSKFWRWSALVSILKYLR